MRIRQLGALTGADLGTATQTLDALSTRRLNLQRALIEAQRGGVAISQQLASDIMALDAEWDALDTSVDSLTTNDLPGWLARAQSMGTDIDVLEGQFALATNTSSMHTMMVLGAGLAITLAVAGGLAYYARKHAKKGMRGLRGTPKQHENMAWNLIGAARSRMNQGYASGASEDLIRADQEAMWAPVAPRAKIHSAIENYQRAILLDKHGLPR